MIMTLLKFAKVTFPQHLEDGENRQYLILAEGAWGKGKTFDEAYDNCREAYRGKPKRFHVYSVDPSVRIDDGMFVYDWDCDNPYYRIASVGF